MGKSDEKQTKMRAHKATEGESKHNNNYNNKPSFETLGSIPLAPTFEATDYGGLRNFQWPDHFRKLSEYETVAEACLVPITYYTNPTLGQWVSTQPTQVTRNTEETSNSMTAERIGALHGIGFDWVTSKTDMASIWSERFQQLCQFKAQFGHYNVPIKYAANLGTWVSTQRSNYRLYQEGKPNSMTAEHIRELESVQFKWELSSFSWNERFGQLHAFTVQFGHCVVPLRYAANPNLGKWVSTQRSKYRLYQDGKPSPMTAERVRALDGIGFDWGKSKTDFASMWRLQFQQLCEFKAQFGHCSVPQRYAAIPKLGKWVHQQRHNCRSYQDGKPSPMTEEHIRSLNGIGFDWGTSKTDLASIWRVRFQELCEFKEQSGHCLVPQRYAINLPLLPCSSPSVSEQVLSLEAHSSLP